MTKEQLAQKMVDSAPQTVYDGPEPINAIMYHYVENVDTTAKFDFDEMSYLIEDIY